jgi:hypothetical protein
MYEYKFVKIEVKYKPFAAQQIITPDYHQVIREHAGEGWRLVQVFAPPLRGYGLAAFVELIFEREA